MRKRGWELLENILSTSRPTTRWCVPFLRMRGNALEGAAPLCSFECQWPCFGELTNGIPSQGNIEMNQHRQCLLTMIKNSSGVIMVWQIVCDQNHSFQTPIKVLKICEGHFRTQNVWNKIFNIFWFIIGTVCNLKIDQSSHNSHQKMSEILMFSPCKILIHCLCNRHSEATHIS